MAKFDEEFPSLESNFRSVVLFGRNSASYKFSLAESLVQLMDAHRPSFVSLEELAVPYSAFLAAHLRESTRQGTATSSRFMAACNDFNADRISHADLIAATLKYGFRHVLEAFHVINQSDIPVKFFEVASRNGTNGIVLTDALLQLGESVQLPNFHFEVEARWRLVETAWAQNLSPNVLPIFYDATSAMLCLESIRRINVTSARNALNGYQKGKCFYCFGDLLLTASDDVAGMDVDHFFPFALQRITRENLNGIWNLVLACRTCNRGQGGKSSRVPYTRYMERLLTRNDFLIDSHHPLRETLIAQLGSSEQARLQFLQRMDHHAINNLIQRWRPEFEHAPAF